MIQACELRIGNLIYANNDYKKILAITKDEVWDIDCNCWRIEDLKPIKLNKALYLNIRLPKDDLGSIFFDYNENSQCIELIFNTDTREINCSEFKYFHQLQNFFFFFTGSELKFEENYIESRDDTATNEILEIANNLFGTTHENK